MVFRDNYSLPWIVMGDFNAYIKEEEKIGYDGIVIEPCDEMIHCFNYCRLVDLAAVGCFHTCSNNQASSSWMRIKLDRVLGDDLWLEKFDA